MEIYVNGALALIKKDSSFEYVSENRLFTGSDDYTFNITFPMRGCPQNTAIFGEMARKDCDHEKVIYDCEIRDRGFVKSGCIAITGVNEAEITAQFLEGRSEQNYNNSFDDIYINELDLGRWPDNGTAENVTVEQAWRGKGRTSNGLRDAVALPWWNDSSSYLNNCVTQSFGQPGDEIEGWHWVWGGDYELPDGGELSWQPYLMDITEMICRAVGYECDLSEWDAHEGDRYLLICNTLPASWDVRKYAAALPAWTVAEYFEKLELFLRCEFLIDHRLKKITMRYSRHILNEIAPVELPGVIDEYSTEITYDKPEAEYIDAVNLKYADRDDELWNTQCCDWAKFRDMAEEITLKDLQEMLPLERIEGYYDYYPGSPTLGKFVRNIILVNGFDPEKVYYLKDKGVTVGFFPDCTNWTGLINYKRSVHSRWYPKELNVFGARIVDESEEAQTREIEFVPARVDSAPDHGSCLFLSPGDFAETEVEGDTTVPDPVVGSISIPTTKVMKKIEAGEQDEAPEYYDKIYVGYWDGTPFGELGKLPYFFPFPIVKPITYATYSWDDVRIYNMRYSLSINTDEDYKQITYRIDPYKKYTFKFLSDSIPNVRALFYIHGKRYLCEKITATFTERGMSQLLKGEFYRVID